MLKDSVMNKAILYLSLATCLFSSTSLAHSSNQDEITLKLDGNREIGVSTQTGLTSETYFCDGHIVVTTIYRRMDFDGDNEFINHSIDIKFNDKKLKDLSFSDELNKFRHFGVDYLCRGAFIGIDVYGYNDSSVESGSLLLGLKIDKQSGHALD